MTEADENNLRTLLTKVRQEDPEGFVAIVAATRLARMEPGDLAIIEQFDEDEIRVSAVLVVQGVQATTAVVAAAKGVKP